MCSQLNKAVLCSYSWNSQIPEPWEVLSPCGGAFICRRGCCSKDHPPELPPLPQDYTDTTDKRRLRGGACIGGQGCMKGGG